MKTYQLILAGYLVFSFTVTLMMDFQSRKAREALGVPGAIVTCVVFGLLVWLYIKAGAFSLI
jgi:cytosine/uracil/thiamine/allantoin permease